MTDLTSASGAIVGHGRGASPRVRWRPTVRVAETGIAELESPPASARLRCVIGLVRRRQQLLWPLIMLAFLAGIGSWCEPHAAGEAHHHAVSASHAWAENAGQESDTEPQCVPTEQTTSAARAYGDSFSPAGAAAVLQSAQATVPLENASGVGGRYLAARPSPVQLFCIQRI